MVVIAVVMVITVVVLVRRRAIGCTTIGLVFLDVARLHIEPVRVFVIGRGDDTVFDVLASFEAGIRLVAVNAVAIEALEPIVTLFVHVLVAAHPHRRANPDAVTWSAPQHEKQCYSHQNQAAHTQSVA